MMEDHDDHPGEQPQRWTTDPLTNYPGGPDDAGNAVMHGIGFLVSGWRWFVGKFTNGT